MHQNEAVPDVKEKRSEWEKKISQTDADKLVFLDESGVNINMTRHYGRAVGKKRAVDNTPENELLTILRRILQQTLQYYPPYV